MPRTSTRVWLAFGLLALAWGSSYLWIKIGLGQPDAADADRGPAPVRRGVPRDRRRASPARSCRAAARMYGHLLVMSVINIVIPFTLITVGEQSIDSALASILNATVPLGVIVIAPFFLPDERITPARIAGLAVGFAGVILLVAPDLVNLGDSDLTGELLMLGSSLSYACGNVYARRNVRGPAADDPGAVPGDLRAVIVAARSRPSSTGRGRPCKPAPEAIVAVDLARDPRLRRRLPVLLLRAPALGRDADVDGRLRAAGRRDRARARSCWATRSRSTGSPARRSSWRASRWSTAARRCAALGARLFGRAEPDPVEAVEAALTLSPGSRRGTPPGPRRRARGRPPSAAPTPARRPTGPVPRTISGTPPPWGANSGNRNEVAASNDDPATSCRRRSWNEEWPKCSTTRRLPAR